MTEVVEGRNLEPAMISPVSGGMVRTWTEDETQLWVIDDPETLSTVMGRGQIARTVMPGNRVREIALLDSKTGTLFVQPRFASPTDPQGESGLLTKPFQLTKAKKPAEGAWEDLESLLASIAISAAGRGEFWLAELGGWSPPQQPYCLFTALDEKGAANAVMEANPAPVGTGIWPDVPADQPGVSVSAPASQETIEAAGIFAVSAIETWDVAPWDIALTFGKLADFA